MLTATQKSHKTQKQEITTAEAFYRVFCVLPKPDQLAVARFIFEDETIRQSLNLPEMPNELTLAAFAEDKADMPVFHNVDELRQDLLS